MTKQKMARIVDGRRSRESGGAVRFVEVGGRASVTADDGPPIRGSKQLTN